MEPVIRAPGLDESAKVLQLYVDGKPHILLGDIEGRHASQLESLLTSQGIPFQRRALNGDSFGPATVGERYEVVGGGYGAIGEPMAILGRSDAYGMGPNQQHLDALNAVLGAVRFVIDKPAPVVPRDTPAKPRERIELDDFPF